MKRTPRRQLSLSMPDAPAPRGFVSTRYQGSKARLAGWLGEIFAPLSFDTALDLFSGTASVAYLLKTMGKGVTTNDLLASAAVSADALVVNEDTRLTPVIAGELFVRASGVQYDDFVERTFSGIYYLDEENRELDTVAQNVARTLQGHARSLALHALYQACLKKRPYNLFHRKNLALRTRDVPRSFGNKVTWERPLRDHFLDALDEANAAVRASGRTHRALSGDALHCDASADLVYVDPPYVGPRDTGTDYVAFYHFLEGLTDYTAWPGRIDRRLSHLPLLHERSAFADGAHARAALASIFDRHRASILVVSYRDDGRPGPDELANMLRQVGKRVHTMRVPKTYALSKTRSHEVVLVGE